VTSPSDLIYRYRLTAAYIAYVAYVAAVFQVVAALR
jgi:hypothetical protein